MLTDRLSLRTIWPTVLVAVLLLGVCITAAVYLRQEQARSAAILNEDVDSRRVAHELETAVENLRVLLEHGNTQVDDLHQATRELLTRIEGFANKAEERRLVNELKAGFADYERNWQRLSENDVDRGEGLRNAIQILKNQMLPTCKKLSAYDAHQIELSEEAHGEKVKWLMWGLIGVGCIGALAGIILGYGVARGLRHSIYQLSVRIRDAADRLGQTLPAVTLSRHGDFPQLHGQMERLTRDIEAVVQQLQQREREILRAEQLRAVGQLAAGAAHELRNPLTAIKILIQTNREESAERGLPTEDLEVIEGELRRMERCLDTFLDFARPPKPERRPIELRALVEKTFRLLEGRARRQKVSLYFQPPDQPLVVEADPEQVQQVLVNLMLNALDAMPRGGNLTVEIRPSPDGLGLVSLCVRDTGPGIPPEVMPRLFDPFVSSKETGMGLGLVVSQRIAEAHGGHLRASNRPEGGACFEFSLAVSTRPDRQPAGRRTGNTSAKY